MQVAPLGSAFSGRKSQRGAPQSSGDIDLVAGPGAASEDRGSARNRAADRHIADELPGTREIAARQNRPVQIRRFRQRIEEVVDPAIRRPSRETDGDEAELRRSTHRRNIAETARQGDSADVGSLVGFASKVSPFGEKIRCKKEIVCTAARPINGAIISDSGHNRGSGRDPDQFFQAFSEGAFVSQTGPNRLMPFENRLGPRPSITDLDDFACQSAEPGVQAVKSGFDRSESVIEARE